MRQFIIRFLSAIKKSIHHPRQHPKNTMKTYDTLASMQEAVFTINSMESEADRVTELCKICYAPNVNQFKDIDPFSIQYKDLVIDLYKSITGQPEYNPERNELSPYLVNVEESPNYYQAGTTSFVGDILTAMGQVLIALDAKPGQRILEYGAGEGGIALEAAKSGCDVTVVDIEPLYLDLINKRAKSQGVKINTLQGQFGMNCGQKFDRILFYEAFHHAIDHIDLAKKLHGMLTVDGFLVLAGEPVIGPHNEQWRPNVPYPWGLRLDGLSFRAIQTYGWMELGFDEAYLIEMLMRSGFLVNHRHCQINERGSAYIAHPYHNEINLGETFMISDEWHIGQADHRWTAKEQATLPLKKHDGECLISVTNYSPNQRQFTITSNKKTYHGKVSYNEEVVVRLPASNKLQFNSNVSADVCSDQRILGIAVKKVQFV